MKDFPFTSDRPEVAEITARFAKDCDFADAASGAEEICRLLNTAILASMQSEEGRSVRASLALMRPEDSLASGVFRFSDPVELSSHSIAKLSASFPFRRGAIGIIFPTQDHPLIWGFVLSKPDHGWLVEIMGPGYIVVRDEPYIQAVVLPDGRRIVFPEMTRLEDEWCDLLFWRTPFRNQVPFELRFQFYDFLRVLSRAMVEHRRGGTLVFVSSTDQTWRRAVDFTYKFSKPEEYLSNLFSELRKWQDKWYRDQDRKRKAKSEKRPEVLYYPDSEQERRLHQALRLVGGLTAVDGAMVMTMDLKILGYGAKLKAPAKQLKVREWLPYRHYASEPMRLEDIGGTRHRSAAQFVSQHPETIILVASQDGRFTIFSCDEAGYEILAHRVELLLL